MLGPAYIPSEPNHSPKAIPLPTSASSSVYFTNRLMKREIAGGYRGRATARKFFPIEWLRLTVSIANWAGMESKRLQMATTGDEICQAQGFHETLLDVANAHGQATGIASVSDDRTDGTGRPIDWTANLRCLASSAVGTPKASVGLARADRGLPPREVQPPIRTTASCSRVFATGLRVRETKRYLTSMTRRSVGGDSGVGTLPPEPHPTGWVDTTTLSISSPAVECVPSWWNRLSKSS